MPLNVSPSGLKPAAINVSASKPQPAATNALASGVSDAEIMARVSALLKADSTLQMVGRRRCPETQTDHAINQLR